MACGWPCGRIIKLIKINSHRRNPLTPWNAFLNVQMHIQGYPQSVHLGYATARNDAHLQKLCDLQPLRNSLSIQLSSCQHTHPTSPSQLTINILRIIMYIYHALINALSAHMIHINLNIIFYTYVEHSPTKTIFKKTKKTRYKHTLTVAETGYWY